MKYFFIAIVISIPVYYQYIVPEHEEFVHQKYEYTMKERAEQTPPTQSPQYQSPMNHKTVNPYTNPYSDKGK